MKTEGKKYLIRESELKEIIREMLLMELYDPNAYDNMHTPGFKGSIPNVGDAIEGLGNLFTNLPNTIIPDSWKEKVAEGDSDFLQYILGLLGAQKAGTARPDIFRNFGQKPGEGSNPDATQVLNVNEAVNWLRTNAYPHFIKGTTGLHCAKYVRMALNRGGLQIPHGMWGAAQTAKGYLNILPANGWQEIPTNQAGELCDVVVVAPYKNRIGKTLHPDGHIAMCIGNGVWASDFIQNSMCGLNGVQPPPSAIHVFRYRNRV